MFCITHPKQAIGIELAPYRFAFGRFLPFFFQLVKIKKKLDLYLTTFLNYAYCLSVAVTESLFSKYGDILDLKILHPG